MDLTCALRIVKLKRNEIASMLMIMSMNDVFDVFVVVELQIILQFVD